MKTTYATLALAGLAAAAPHNAHRSLHEKKDLAGSLSAGIADLTAMIQGGNTFLANLKDAVGQQAKQAINSHDATEDTWVGEATTGNAVTNTIVNKSDKDATWLCWGKAASWITQTAPRVAITVPAGKNVTVSHAISQDQWTPNTGGCAAMFENDGLDHSSQPNQSWMEFSFVTNPMFPSSTFDLSMEVNPKGHNMTIAGPKCVSDMTRCSFHCKDASAPFCGQSGDYFLKNCAAGSQEAVAAGMWGNNDAGGCQGISNTGITKLTTTLHPIKA